MNDTPEESEKNKTELDAIPNESQSLAQEFVDFIRYNKAWWMTPIILVLGFMVVFILLAEQSPILPFIYAVI